MGEPLLELTDVCVVKGGSRLLDRISFTVERGSVHGLVGHNGAGKSTLISAVLGAVQFSGRILFHFLGDGRIGYVPQRLHVDATLPLTVSDFLAAFRQSAPVCLGHGRAARAESRAILERVGLLELVDRPLGALSGGELQRVLFGNALVPEPELLILDEASSGLDHASQDRFEALVAEAKAQSVTVLMVAHDRGQLERLCDQVTVLERGRIAAAPGAA